MSIVFFLSGLRTSQGTSCLPSREDVRSPTRAASGHRETPKPEREARKRDLTAPQKRGRHTSAPFWLQGSISHGASLSISQKHLVSRRRAGTLHQGERP